MPSVVVSTLPTSLHQPSSQDYPRHPPPFHSRCQSTPSPCDTILRNMILNNINCSFDFSHRPNNYVVAINRGIRSEINFYGFFSVSIVMTLKTFGTLFVYVNNLNDDLRDKKRENISRGCQASTAKHAVISRRYFLTRLPLSPQFNSSE